MNRVGTAYAAKKLKVSQTVVRNMVASGLLKDYGKTKNNRSRHFTVLDKSEVIEFAKNHIRVGRSFVAVENGEGEVVAKPARQPKVTVRETIAPATNGNGNGSKVLDRLDRIEATLNRLAEVWG